MNQDITYCISSDCEYIAQCKRNLNRYSVDKINTMSRYSCVDGEDCKENDFEMRLI